MTLTQRIFGLCLLLTCTSLVGGVKIKMESQVLGQETIRTGWLYIGDENRLRIDSDVDSEGNASNSVVFRGDLQTMYMIDHEEQEYVQLDKERIEALSKQFSEAMQQMDEQLAKLPEGQRKIMEDMMKKNLPNSEDFTVEVKSVGPEDEFEKYEVWIGPEKRSEVWVAPPEQLGVPSDSLQVFKNMSAFYESLLQVFRDNPLMLSIGENPFPGFTQMKGFPVRIRHLQENQETRLSKSEPEDFAEEFFGPPADYTELRRDFQ